MLKGKRMQNGEVNGAIRLTVEPALNVLTKKISTKNKNNKGKVMRLKNLDDIESFRQNSYSKETYYRRNIFPKPVNEQ